MGDGLGGRQDSVFEKHGHIEIYGKKKIVVGNLYRDDGFCGNVCQVILASPGKIRLEYMPGIGSGFRVAETPKGINVVLGKLGDVSSEYVTDLSRCLRRRADWLEARANRASIAD